MALIYYPPQILANAATGLPLANLKGIAGKIIARGNPASSPSIYEDQGGTAIIAGANLTVTENTFVRGFYVDDAFGRVSFYGDGVEVPLVSEEGNAARIEELGAAADAAALAAQNSETAAEAAKAAAEDAEAAVAAAPIAIPVGGTTGQALVKASGANRDVTWATVGGGTGGGGGVSDHGLLSGLTDDDHLQYHNDTRGDARYYRKDQVDSIALAAAGANSGADRNRANHTGTQPISSVTNLETRLVALEAGGGGGGGGPIDADDITDATTVGKALMRATSAANGRTTLGAAAASDVAGKVSGPTGMVIAPPMTQAAYDALATKAPLTLYPIIG
ncbi:hypothetical protein [Isoptericola sp. NPDC056605]|uniref:phage upper tail fiber protein n=1 Tax=Isoptericola sp. NPDC056605 TaxID=3345876 RepID=UPI0036B75B4B